MRDEDFREEMFYHKPGMTMREETIKKMLWPSLEALLPNKVRKIFLEMRLGMIEQTYLWCQR